MLLIFHTVAHEIRYASKALHHITSINYIRLCYWKCTHNNKNIIITYLNIHLHSKICFDTSCTLNFFMLLPLETTVNDISKSMENECQKSQGQLQLSAII